MPKMALADCSGVGDAVIAKTLLLEICHTSIIDTPMGRDFDLAKINIEADY
jgi:hypothetical protein